MTQYDLFYLPQAIDEIEARGNTHRLEWHGGKLLLIEVEAVVLDVTRKK